MLLSGVVRNRKVAAATATRPTSRSIDGSIIPTPSPSMAQRVVQCLRDNVFTLRVHKFSFHWDLLFYLIVGIASLIPFAFSGNRVLAVIPLSVWALLNMLFIMEGRRVERWIPGFAKFKLSFQTAIEDSFSPKVIPMLSISFLLVALSLAVTGHKLGGPPLCYQSCHICLSSWHNAVLLDPPDSGAERMGCGFSNGEQLLAYYTMVQTSFLLFCAVVLVIAACLAWRVTRDELRDRQSAEDWLKREDKQAFKLRDSVIGKFGSPGSPVRAEGNVTWVFFGIVAALTLMLLGWHNWDVLPRTRVSTLLILLNVLVILLSTLVLHVGFFGRLLSLYTRNFMRVQHLSHMVRELGDHQIDAWWNCRNFVLNEDLALDYDIGGLAVSATFLIDVLTFSVIIIQMWRDGFMAIMEPPGSYCAYMCLYLTMCLIKIFTLATSTFEEQHRHIIALQSKSVSLLARGASTANFDWEYRQAAAAALAASVSTASIASVAGNAAVKLISAVSPRVGAHLSGNSSTPSFAQSHSNLPPSSSLDPSDDFVSMALVDIEEPTHPPYPPGMSRASSHKAMSSSPSLGDAVGPPSLGGHSVSVGSSSNFSANNMVAPSGLTINTSVPPMGTGESVSIGGKTLTPLRRTGSYSSTGAGGGGVAESRRAAIAEMISHIRNYDPYPCILGIPVMPALFSTSKFYIFITFMMIGARVLVEKWKEFREF